MSGSQVADLVGSRLGDRYRLESVLGSGGMSVVYRGVDESLGRPVAVKVFAASSADADDLRRQDGEVRMLAGLSHPGLVTLFDAGADNSERGELAYIVMELVEGDTLQARIAAGPMRPSDVAAIGADLADALHYIHGRAVVHRDIKPANVLLPSASAVDARPPTKLADFGIARITDGTHLTAAGSIIGTVSYLSPEQAMGTSVDSSADVYALGLVLLECLTGEKAFPGSAAESASARVLRDPIVPEALPAAWRALLAAMTARVPTDRPPAREASRALRGLEGHDAPALRTASLGGAPGASDAPTTAMATGSATEAVVTEAMPTAASGAATARAAGETETMLPTAPRDAPADAPTRTMPSVPAAGSDAPTEALVPGAGTSADDGARAAEWVPAVPSAPGMTAVVASAAARSAASPGAASPRGSDGTAPPAPRRRPWAIVVAAVLLILAAVIGWSVVQGLDTGAGTVRYPSVPGELGISLEQLQRSVEGSE